MMCLGGWKRKGPRRKWVMPSMRRASRTSFWPVVGDDAVARRGSARGYSVRCALIVDEATLLPDSPPAYAPRPALDARCSKQSS